MLDTIGYISRFKIYDRDNPLIWEKFEELAFVSAQSTRNRFSAKAIIEHIRWDTNIVGTGDYKITDTWTAFYLRKFLLKYPRFRNFFSLKTSYADDMLRDDFDGHWRPVFNGTKDKVEWEW